MWFLYLLLLFAFFTSFVVYRKESKWKIMKIGCYHLKKNTIYLLFIFSFFCFFSSLRYPKMGTDTYVYFELFEAICSNQYIIKFSLKPEWGYLIINKIISIFTSNKQIFLLLINSFIIYSFLSYINKYSKNIWFSVLLFILMGYFDTSMNLIRFNIAFAITLFAHKYLIENKIFHFIIIIALSSLFHITSWIFVIAPIIYKINLKNISFARFIIIFTLFLFIAYIFTSKILNIIFENVTIFGDYENNDNFGIQEQAKLAPILNFLIIYLVIIYTGIIMWRKFQLNIEDYMLFKLLILSSIFLILSFTFTPIGRLSYLFSYSSIVLIPNATLQIKKTKKRMLLSTILISFFILRYIIIAYFRPEWTGVYPYKFFFQ